MPDNDKAVIAVAFIVALTAIAVLLWAANPYILQDTTDPMLGPQGLVEGPLTMVYSTCGAYSFSFSGDGGLAVTDGEPLLYGGPHEDQIPFTFVANGTLLKQTNLRVAFSQNWNSRWNQPIGNVTLNVYLENSACAKTNLIGTRTIDTSQQYTAHMITIDTPYTLVPGQTYYLTVEGRLPDEYVTTYVFANTPTLAYYAVDTAPPSPPSLDWTAFLSSLLGGP